MTLPITREQAIEVLDKYDPERRYFKHYIESEAIMRDLACKLGEDIEYWGMLGLLHDVDWALIAENPKEHLKKTPEILKDIGFDEEFIEVVVSHGYGFEVLPEWQDKKREKKIEHALAASETITGLIYAYALMRGKNISDMDIAGLKKRFKEKKFAENCSREIIKEIEQVGLTLDEFFELAINAMKNIKEEIELK